MASASSVTVNAQFAAGRVAQFRTRRSASRSSSAVRSSVKVRAGAPTYEEEFDGNTGQAVQILWQSVETCDAGGITWSYRLGEVGRCRLLYNRLLTPALNDESACVSTS